MTRRGRRSPRAWDPTVRVEVDQWLRNNDTPELRLLSDLARADYFGLTDPEFLSGRVGATTRDIATYQAVVRGLRDATPFPDHDIANRAIWVARILLAAFDGAMSAATHDYFESVLAAPNIAA